MIFHVYVDCENLKMFNASRCFMISIGSMKRINDTVKGEVYIFIALCKSDLQAYMWIDTFTDYPTENHYTRNMQTLQVIFLQYLQNFALSLAQILQFLQILH